MFRSRSRFNNAAPMSRRGVRIGLVSTVVLAMVAVLASTVGVISSQTNTDDPSVAFGSGTYIAVEGESLTITLTSRSSQGYELKLDADSTTPSSFNFKNDVGGLVLSPNVGKQELITDLPQTVDIDSGTTMITLWFRAANDLMTETGEQLVLSAKPGDSTAVTTAITLNDPPKLEATFSGPSPITEGGSADIGITLLNSPLTLSQLFSRRSGQSGYTREEFTGSNFEDISSIAGANFPLDDNNERYNRNLGFDFWFYGKRHSYIAVHTNGFVGFTNDAKADVDEFVDPLPGVLNGDKTPGTAGRPALPIVAPLLSPIAYIDQTDAAFYGARLGAGTAEDRYIVQYTKAASLVPGAPNNRVASTFQVALYASGTIEFRYEDIPTSVQQVSKIGISNGTGSTMSDEFSYRANNFMADAETNDRPEANVRLVYTPKDSLINAVIKDSEDNIFETVDFLPNVPVGMQSGSFSVSHPDDNTDWDGSRVYTVELASTVPLVTAPDPAPAAVTYTVNDNDKPEVTLERADGDSAPISIEENSQIELVAKLTNAPSGGAPEALVVNLGASGASSDFTYPASVTIPEDGTQVPFMVMANQDNDAEFEESITLKVTTLGYGGNTPTPDVPDEIDIMIPLNDTIAVTGITASDTMEGDDVTVIVTLNRVLPAGTANEAVKIELDGTDRINDITDSSWNIGDALESGTSVELMLTLTDDNLLEGDEEITLNLVVDATLDDILPAGDRISGVTFNILDDEDGTIGFIEPIKTTYNEGDSVELMVGLASGVSTVAAIVVDYEIDLISADPGDIVDGGDLTRLATIPTGANAAVITIALTGTADDDVAEETELFEVLLTDASSSNLAASASVAITTATSPSVSITILDDDTLEYSFVGTGMVSEDSPAYTVRLRRLGMLPGGGDAMVAYTVSGSGSRAASANDFAGSSYPTGTFVFTGYAAESAEITLPAVADDAAIEGDETFQIALTSRTETHDVTLADNDVPVVVVERVSGSGPVAEGNMVQFRARLTNAGPSGATENLTVNLSLGLTSTVFADDVSFLQSSVTIPMGMTDMTFMVMVENDELAEFPEQVRIVAESVDTALLGNNLNSGRGYDLEIVSDDMITVTSIEVDDTNEGAGPALVRITLSQPLPENVSSGALMLNLVNGERASDLSGLPDDVTDDLKRSSATQPPAPISTEVMIPLVDDMLLEGTELVSLWLQVVSPDLATLMTDANASFNIIDNEDGRVAITAPSKTMYQEGDTFDLTIALPTGVFAGAPIMVDYRIEFVDDDGNGNTRATASAADITGGTVSGSATIPANQNSIPVTIDLNDDSEGEETELFKVSLARVVADIPATPDPTARIISILDNEQLEYSFVGSGTVSEDSTAYTGQLRRLGTITEAAMVTYAVSGIGSSPAVADDFDGKVFPSGNFEFTNYNARAKITLTVADDKKLEAEETFRITSVGKTLDVKLVDNESGEVRIDRVGTTSPEDGDMVEFDVSLPDGVTTDSPITVNFEIVTPPGVSVEIIEPLGLVTVPASGLRTGFAQGLALPVRGLAQVARTYSIMIPAGQTSVRLTIQLTHDGNTEVREQLMVSLLSASSSSASAPLVVVNSKTTGLANVLLENFDAPAFSGLPATGGPVLPVWLLLTLLLTGIVLLGGVVGIRRFTTTSPRD